MCSHRSSCPGSDTLPAHVVAARPEQGWCVNCTFLRSLGTAMSDGPRGSV
ncbi:DUF5999 family protein [Streptomyces sp. TRM76130]|nr:DUF5999 family protein [Streptomyces sp. TRM76130]